MDVEEIIMEERNPLSVEYKNVINAHRDSWRIIYSIEYKEESKGNDDHITTIREYRAKVESDLTSIYDGILYLLDSHFLPSSTTREKKKCLKMKGDYHKYLI
eukprot:Gb_17240 [translate_table: standard]